MGDRLATIDIGRKEGGCCAPFGGGRAESPSNTTWPGPRSNSVPSGIFIHPAVSPQETWPEDWGGGFAPFHPFLGGGWVTI